MRKHWIVMGLLAIGIVLSAGEKTSADVVDRATVDGIAIDAVNFPDAAIREYAGVFDADKDGVLSLAERSEAKKVTVEEQYSERGYIKKDSVCTEQKIATFKGMELFPNLEYICIQSACVMSDTLLEKGILPYVKQIKDVRIFCPPSGSKGSWQYGNHHITWDIGEDMNCEILAIRGISFDSLTISSQKLKRLSIEYCDLSKSYSINTPNLERLGMTWVCAKALNYGIMDKLQILTLCMQGVKDGTDHMIHTSPITAFDLNKTKKIRQLELEGCKIDQLDLTPAKDSLKSAVFTQNRNVPLKQFKIGEMQELESLKIICGNLPALDVSKCNKLRRLDFTSYGTKTIKLTKSLVCLSLKGGSKDSEKRLACKSLDLSKCKGLEVLELGYYKKLQSLNLKNNTKLYYLSMLNMTLDKLVLPKKKHKHKQWLMRDGNMKFKVSNTSDKYEDVLEDRRIEYDIYPEDYNIFLNGVTIKNVDMTQLTSLKDAKITIKKGILKSKKRVKKVTISRKLKGSEKRYIKKLAAKKKIKIVVK